MYSCSLESGGAAACELVAKQQTAQAAGSACSSLQLSQAKAGASPRAPAGPQVGLSTLSVSP